MDIKASEIKKLLKLHYSDHGWVFFDELRLGTGYYSHRLKIDVEQRMDGWAMNTWPSSNFLSLAFEIKISRSDFTRELRRPHKRDCAYLVSNEFYFVAPYDLINISEVPDGCGLMIVTKTNSLKTIKKASHRKLEPFDMHFIASILRRVSKDETAQ
jgi:hypothetical protein